MLVHLAQNMRFISQRPLGIKIIENNIIIVETLDLKVYNWFSSPSDFRYVLAYQVYCARQV